MPVKIPVAGGGLWGIGDVLYRIMAAEKGTGPRVLGRSHNSRPWLPIAGIRRLNNITEGQSLADGTWFPLAEVTTL